jgi:outer membrane protein OmpA-like peptidoglycan-associated protein
MKTGAIARIHFPGQFAVLMLASAISVPMVAQQPMDHPPAPPAATQPSPEVSSSTNTPKEGFWGRVYPFARKKWVHRQTDPIKDRLNELDEVNAKNARDIQDVDSRATAGIQKAQSAADAANQTAMAASQTAQQAGTTAQGASSHVDKLNGTVSGLDQYRQVNTLEIPFHGGQPVLSKDAKSDLDQLAASLTGRQGYVIEIEAHSPSTGSMGIQNSSRLAEAVKRYLVSEHQIPVYRMHAVALGNAVAVSSDQATGTGDAKPARIKASSVSVRLMENSLAAQESTPPHGVASLNGAERP